MTCLFLSVSDICFLRLERISSLLISSFSKTALMASSQRIGHSWSASKSLCLRAYSHILFLTLGRDSCTCQRSITLQSERCRPTSVCPLSSAESGGESFMSFWVMSALDIPRSLGKTFYVYTLSVVPFLPRVRFKNNFSRLLGTLPSYLDSPSCGLRKVIKGK